MLYRTYRWNNNYIRMWSVEVKDPAGPWEITSASGSGHNINNAIEEMGIVDAAFKFLTHYRDNVSDYRLARRSLCTWCRRAKSYRLYSRAAVGDKTIRDLLGVRDEIDYDWLAQK